MWTKVGANCHTYLSKTPLEHFIASLKSVIADKSLTIKQMDPIKIIEAFDEWEMK